jgi:hypothetical protein
MTSTELLRAALQSAQAAWTGCDWETEFGPGRINLRGLTSRQARLAAQATRGEESTQWREVCHYLDAVERDARLAAELASAAVDFWSLGNTAEASCRLEEAIALEAHYRPPFAYPRLRAVMQSTATNRT